VDSKLGNLFLAGDHVGRRSGLICGMGFCTLAMELDRSDPLNLIINNPAMDDADPPDWSQLGALWPEEKQFNDYLDYNMASDILDMDLDMSLTAASTASGIEPSALHLGASEARLGYSSFDDPFGFPASASPADILAAQFPFAFHPGDSFIDPPASTSSSTGLETPNLRQRRLSITSSSSSSGPSFSPVSESIPSPGYSSDSTYNSSSASFSSSETSVDQSLTEQPAVTTADAPRQPVSDASTTTPDFSGNPAAELAHRVRQSAGVMLAVPMNGTGAPYQPGQSFPSKSLPCVPSFHF
jgi:hypothetical protein